MHKISPLTPRYLTLLFVACSVVSPAAADSLDEGKALLESGDLAGARAAFQSVLAEDGRNAGAAYFLGMTFQEEERHKDAIRWFRQAIKLNPDVSLYHQRLGEALGQSIRDASMFTQMRKAGSVRKAFERAVQLDPDNLDARRGLMTYYLNAPSVAGGGREKAEAEAEVIAEKDVLAGHRAWFSIYLDSEDYGRAFAELDKIIALRPDDQDALLMRGVLLANRGQYEQAFMHLKAWLSRSPEAMPARYQLGRTSALSGLRLEDGEAALLVYIGHTPGPGEPSRAWAHYRLGQVYEHMNRHEAARKAYRAALADDPDHKEAARALKALK